MDEKHIRELLEKVREGSCDINEAMKKLKHWPAETIDFACLGCHKGRDRKWAAGNSGGIHK